MKLPDKVKVAGFDITIEDWHPHSASASRRYGEFSNIELCIRVDTSTNVLKVCDTLLHELNHAIFWAYNIYDEDKEERIAGMLSTAWTQIYRDNPEILSYIKSCVKK